MGDPCVRWRVVSSALGARVTCLLRDPEELAQQHSINVQH